MIDPKELRIGNLLFNKFEKKHEVVDNFKQGNFSSGVMFFKEDKQDPVHATENVWKLEINGKLETVFEPIEINEEVLLKAGFKSKDPYYIEVDGVNIAIDLNGDLQLSDAEYSGILLSLKVISFHHLQNIVFDLTGKELTL